MTNTLTMPTAAAVVARLLAAEAAQDDERATGDATPGSVDFPAHLQAADLAEMFSDTYMSVSSAGGDLLYLLARAAGVRTAVEFGTSFGLSAIYLASAVRDNGGGCVIGTELHPGKAAAAQQNFVDAGVDDIVDLRVGDARETLRALPRPVDLLLLDGWPNLALPVLQAVEPHLHRNSLIVIDDVDMDWGADLHGPVMSYLAERSDLYFGVRLGLGDGMQVCLKVA